MADCLAQIMVGVGEQVLSSGQLTRASTTLAARSDLWSHLVPPVGDRRWYALLGRQENYDVWLLGWNAGHQTDWHDHGGSSGSFAVAAGRLVEHYRRPRGGCSGARSVRPGGVVTFGPAHVHNVGHAEGNPALSVHVYSPALTAMTYYVPTPFGFSARETRLVDSPHGSGSEGALGQTPWSERNRLAIDELLAAARHDLAHRPMPREAAAAVAAGATLIDLRPAEEREAEGEMPGAVVIGRNVLEWRLDPQSAHRIPALARYDAELILVCSDGYASSLAAASLRRLGLTRVTDLDGGFHAWKAANLPTAGG